MSDRHLPYWPAGVPRAVPAPQRSVFANLALSAARMPDAEAIHYYGSRITYRRLIEECERLAGFLQQGLGVAAGEPVLLQMLNSPQSVIGTYAILRAGAVVVPLNPMLKAPEIGRIAEDTGARVILCAQDATGIVRSLVEGGVLERAVVATYSDYAPQAPSVPVPAVVAAPRLEALPARMHPWSEALARGGELRPLAASPDDLCLIVYTSGSTGEPRGCMHSHATVQASIAAYAHWNPLRPGSAVLGALPLFHVTGMQVAMHSPIEAGARTVLMTRWDAATALDLTRIERISHWRLITAMLIDLMALPGLDRAATASLGWIGGGGAAMPEAVAARIESLTGLKYVEGYGMSETIAATHLNPPARPKRQCLGIPFVGVTSKVVDPDTLRERGPGEVGEILVAGPQVFLGYWRKPAATAEAFVEIGGERFLRTGDLGYADEEGYFFFVDRLKRMINVAGFKVWPAEVEALLHAHPAVRQACVVAAGDPRRGETVKAYVVLREGAPADTSPDEMRAWCAERMARYKVPSGIAVVDALPLLASGKVDWRRLQETERLKA